MTIFFKTIQLLVIIAIWTATSHSSNEQTSIIRLDIDGKLSRLNFSHSGNIAALRRKLSEFYHISNDTCFLDAQHYRIHIKDEESITVKELLTENNVIRLVTDKTIITSIPVPEMKSKVSERKDDLEYAQRISQSSTRSPIPEIKLPGSTTTRSENKIILASDLDRDAWKKMFRNCNLFQGIRMDKETPNRGFASIFKFKESDNDFPLFQVKDDSYTRAYIKDKEMQSSFVSSQFFDGGIEFSNLYIGFGINAEYLKTNARTNTQKQKYLTYCFNFPRVTLQLDLSYLELTSQFIEVIDVVLSLNSPDEQIIKLKEVLSDYGHVYPRNVVLGGQLYHTEVHDNEEKAEEARKRLNAEAPFSASIIKSAKIYAGASSNDQSQSKSSEQTSFLSFEAIGGDTRLNRDPALWTNTVADPSLWRIIEQDDYKSIITLFDQERQEKLQNIIKYDIAKNIKWKQHAITVRGGEGKEYESNYWYSPTPVLIDDNQSIYVADCGNHPFVEWKSEEKNQLIIAGTVFDKQNMFAIILDWHNKRVIKWSDENSEPRQIIEDIDCRGLAMDKNGYLYVSDYERHEIRRWKIGDSYGTLVAGGNGQGDHLNQFNKPTSIFVDEDYSLYVSDCANHRVMKWVKDAKEGIIVAGGNGQGNSLKQLFNPQAVNVDHFGHIYIADFNNHRVMRWCEGAKEGTIVVGGNGQGGQSNQLYCPFRLKFDQQRNLYVADLANHRVQKFEAELN